jgi:O-antigen/teichoic acid export membrane protein
MTRTDVRDGHPPGPAGRADVSPLHRAERVSAPRPARVASWSSIVRRFGTLAVGEGSARLIGVVAVLLLARRLPPSDFGVVMFGLTLSAWFSLCVDAGTETLGIRDMARTPERLREIAGPILGLRLALSIVAMAVFVSIVWFTAAGQGDRVTLLVFAVILPATALNLRTIVVGAGVSTALGVGNIASQLVFLVGVVFAAHDVQHVAWVPAIRAGGELCYGAVIVLALWPRYGFVRPRLHVEQWLVILRRSAPLFASGIASVLMFSSGVLILGFIAPRDAVGLYAAAHRPVVFCAAVSGLLLVSLLASFSAVDNRLDAVRIFRRTVWLAMASIPCALIISAASRTLLGLAYGQHYEAAALVLAVLIWVVPVRLIGGAWGITLLATHHQGIQLRHNVVGAAATIVGTVAGVTFLGILGAAVAAVVAQLLVVALNYRASVALGIAPPLDVVLPGRCAWRRNTSW